MALPPPVIPPAPPAHIHLIAACGTAMGSLACLLRAKGYRVTGSDDHVYPPMSDFLRAEGIEVRSGFRPQNLDPRPNLVVVGNAVSRGNPELEAVLDLRLPYTCLPEVVRDLFLAGRRPLVVTGTHGKTTTTALAAHLLRAFGQDPSFLVAGLPRDLPRPYHLGEGEWFVLEGDEYDSAYFAKVAKFLYYRPEVVVLNNVEFDHADIYRDLDEIRRAFRQLVNQVPRRGVVIGGGDDPVVAELLAASPAPVQTVGLGSGCDWRAEQLVAGPQGQTFSLVGPRTDGRVLRVDGLHLKLPGVHNVRNALAAMAAAAWTGRIDLADRCQSLAEALASFTGVRRRQELLGRAGGVTLVDDFAHHPTAVAATLAGLRSAHPGAQLWAIFEPASATNARATFEERYADAFAAADCIVVAPVPRPERRGNDAPFCAARLAAQLQSAGKRAWALTDADAIASHLAAHTGRGDLVVFMSNAGFGGVQGKTLRALEARGT